MTTNIGYDKYFIDLTDPLPASRFRLKPVNQFLSYIISLKYLNIWWIKLEKK